MDALHVVFTIGILCFEACWLDAYNTDTASFGILEGANEKSFFGYSVQAHAVDGNLKLWTGSPKYVSNSQNNTGTSGGAVFDCAVSATVGPSSMNLTQDCHKLRLSASKASGNYSKDGQPAEAKSSLPTVASSCRFQNDLCGYTATHPRVWFRKDDYKRLLGTKEKYNYRGRTRFCYPDLKQRTRLSGPPSFTIHGGLVVLSPDDIMKTVPKGMRLVTRLSSQRVKAWSGKTQCLRFCYNAHSILDYNEKDPLLKSMTWYTGHIRISPKPDRSLEVFLRYEGSPHAIKLYEFRGPRDFASEFWNYTEIDIAHNKSAYYKLEFKITILNNRRSKICSPASDIALSDIDVSNIPCKEEAENVDIMEGEQSVGMSLDVGTDENGQKVLTACGSLWQQNCGFAKETSGVCYQFNGNASKPSIIRNPELKGCIRGKLDIVMLVDQSGSVNQCNFQKVKSWLRNIVRGFEIGPTQQDISVILYSSKRFTRYVIKLGFANYGNSGDVKKKRMLQTLRELSYEAGKTYTGVAFKYANDMLWGNQSRPDAKKMVILLTDGATTPEDAKNLEEQVQITKSRNVTILAVGVAGYNETELKSISGETNFFGVKDFSELGKVQDTLRQTVSHSNLEGSRRSKSMQNCQMGFSLKSDQENLLMGAPGCFDRAGDVFRYGSIDARKSTTNATKPTTATIIHDITISPQTTPARSAKKAKTISIPSLEDLEKVFHKNLADSYFGYAVTLGNFFGGREGSYNAASAPRYDGKGCVLIYKTSLSAMSSNHVVYGHQLGEYFGASLCAEDVNGDGYTDLFVGAPLHTDAEPDEGRVYLYMGGVKMGTKPDYVLKGSGKSFSRFGLVITSIGDVTLDGIMDVVVSAPAEDQGRGAVYIFPGNKNTFRPIFSQRISGYLLSNHQNLQLFGQSVAGNVDLDNNGYNDILVGAPGSDKIVFLRSKPVVRISAKFFFPIKAIDRRNKNCWTMQNHSIPTSPMDIPCLLCTTCFTYYGKSLPSEIGVIFKIHPDILKNKPRLRFHENTGNVKYLEQTLMLHGVGNEICTNYTLYLEKDIDDMLTKLQMEMTFDMMDSKQTELEGSSEIDNALFPVLDISTVKIRRDVAAFMIDCGDNLTCNADISVQGSSVVSQSDEPITVHDVSESRILSFNLEVENAGPEEAHAVFVTLRYPVFLSFSVMKTECFEPENEQRRDSDNFRDIRVSLKKTFLGEEEKCSGKFNFILTPKAEKNQIQSLDFYVNSSTISRNDSLLNNEKSMTLELTYSSSFSITGYTDQHSMYRPTNSTNYTGPLYGSFSHIYKIKNTGKLHLRNITIRALWPICADLNDSISHIRYDGSLINGGVYQFREEGYLRNSTSSVCDSQNSLPTMRTSSQCISRSVTQCAYLSVFIDEISPYSEIPISLSGSVEWSDITDPQHVLRLVSQISVETNLTSGVKWPTNQDFEHSVTTVVHPRRVMESRDEVNEFGLPWWLIAVSVAVGLFLLLALYFVLRKMGFFDSKYADKKREAEDDFLFLEEVSKPLRAHT